MSDTADTEQLSEEERAAAAEWEAMAGGEAATAEQGAGVSTRVLDQEEIDSLLGLAGGADGDDDKSGIQAIVNSALVSYERLPMLEVVLDRKSTR